MVSAAIVEHSASFRLEISTDPTTGQAPVAIRVIRVGSLADHFPEAADVS
jgi:hypothetical protein